MNDEKTPMVLLNDAIARRAPLREVAILYTRYVLQTFGGNKSHAAPALGIDRRTIQRWSKDGPSMGSRNGRPNRSQLALSGTL